CLLVDTASRPGMSGSPVILRTYGTHMSPGEVTVAAGAANKFIGVYSGRLHTQDPLEAQIGMVWPAIYIDEIIDGGLKEYGKTQQFWGRRCNLSGDGWPTGPAASTGAPAAFNALPSPIPSEPSLHFWPETGAFCADGTTGQTLLRAPGFEFCAQPFFSGVH